MELIYRMCSIDEFNKHSITPVRCNRNIFFSKNIQFIFNRVLDGKFNNSNYDEEKYVRLVVYEVDSYRYFKKQGKNEVILDRRDIPMIKFNRLL